MAGNVDLFKNWPWRVGAYDLLVIGHAESALKCQ